MNQKDAGQNTLTPNVVLFNSFWPRTSLYRYSVGLWRALEPGARLVNLVGHRRLRGLNYEGEVVQGFQPGIWAFESCLNWLDASRIVRSAIRQELTSSSDSLVLHFTNPEWRPLNLAATHVVTIHDNPSALIRSDAWRISPQLKWMLGRHLKAYSAGYYATVSSHYVESSLRAYGYSGPIEVVPHFVDGCFHPLRGQLKPRKDFGLPDDRVLVLSVSSSTPRKNLAILTPVMERLGPRYRLVRVGPGVGDSINFSDLSDERLNLLYNACDVFLDPSTEEGFGLPPLEALAAGLPVVASDIPPHRETVGGVCELVDPHDARALASAIRDVLDSHPAENPAVMSCLARFSIQSFGGRMRGFYRRVMKGGPRT